MPKGARLVVTAGGRSSSRVGSRGVRSNPPYLCGGEECSAHGVVGRERVRERENDPFGTRPVDFRRGVILRLSVQVAACGMNAPPRRGNLERLQNRETLLDLLLGCPRILLGH